MEIKTVLYEVVKKARNNFSLYKLLSPLLEHLPYNKPIYVFALGKAAYSMAEATIQYTAEEPFIRIMETLVITQHGNVKGNLPKTTFVESSHPVPGQDSLLAAETAIRFLNKLKPTDILLVLLSGGGSALMEKPVEGVTMEELIAKTEQLLLDGSNIEDLNTERKKLSAVKGGKLLNHIKCNSMFIFAMSDVPGDKPKYIASNPFLPDAEKSEDTLGVDSFRRFDGMGQKRLSGTEKAIVYKIVANNMAFREYIREAALELMPTLQSDRIHLISTDIAGEAVYAAKEIVKIADLIIKQKGRGFTAFKTPCLLVFGGETNVTVRGKGIGGRCTELALAAADGLSTLSNCYLLTYATDGRDGFCDASGAVVDCNTKNALQEKGIDLAAYLDDNDSYTALKVINAIIPAEHTGINLNDVVLLYVH